MKNDKLSNSPSISAFFPCYNDAGTIGVMVMRAMRVLQEVCADGDYEVLVINDGSSDDSAHVLTELAKLYPTGFRYVNRDKPSGYGGVIRGGIEMSTKDWFFYTDGDAQYDARELGLLIEKIRPDIDVVNGYKLKRHDPFHRIVIGYAYQYFIKLLFTLPIRDVDCDFRLMRRSIFDTVNLEETTGAITFEMVKKIADAGFRYTEVPVHHFYRQYGSSQFFNFGRVARTLGQVFRWWWRLVVKKESAQIKAKQHTVQVKVKA
jgi:glycosyltransferase involved in cell wall biosynthesis